MGPASEVLCHGYDTDTYGGEVWPRRHQLGSEEQDREEKASKGGELSNPNCRWLTPADWPARKFQWTCGMSA